MHLLNKNNSRKNLQPKFKAIANVLNNNDAVWRWRSTSIVHRTRTQSPLHQSKRTDRTFFLLYFSLKWMGNIVSRGSGACNLSRKEKKTNWCVRSANVVMWNEQQILSWKSTDGIIPKRLTHSNEFFSLNSVLGARNVFVRRWKRQKRKY